MLIFVHSRGEKLGPMPLDEVNTRLQAAQLLPEDLAWHEGLPTWIPLKNVQGVIVPERITMSRGPIAPPSGPMPPVISSSGPATPSAGTDPLAICSLVFGILGMFCCTFLVLSLTAVICGHISLSNIKRNPRIEGRALAIVGLVLGYIGIAIGIGYLLFIFGMGFFPAFIESVQ